MNLHHDDPTMNKAQSDLAEQKARAELMHISNSTVDKAIIERFYNEVLDNGIDNVYIDGELITKEKMLQHLANHFPNTQRGNTLVQELFGCSVLELQENPMRHSLNTNQSFEEERNRARYQQLADMDTQIKIKSKKTLDPVQSHYLQTQQLTVDSEKKKLSPHTVSSKQGLTKQKALKQELTAMRAEHKKEQDYSKMSTEELETLQANYERDRSAPGITKTQEKALKLEFQYIKKELNSRRSANQAKLN